jgi:hypothetical protein
MIQPLFLLNLLAVVLFLAFASCCCYLLLPLTSYALTIWQAVVQLLLDLLVVLILYAIQHLLEAIDTLCVFAQQNDIYVALQICKGQLYSLYVDKGTCFGRDDFWSFNGLLDYFHENIHVKWVVDLNSAKEAQLASLYEGKQFWDVHEWQPVSRASYA